MGKWVTLHLPKKDSPGRPVYVENGKIVYGAVPAHWKAKIKAKPAPAKKGRPKSEIRAEDTAAPLMQRVRDEVGDKIRPERRWNYKTGKMEVAEEFANAFPKSMWDDKSTVGPDDASEHLGMTLADFYQQAEKERIAGKTSSAKAIIKHRKQVAAEHEFARGEGAGEAALRADLDAMTDEERAVFNQIAAQHAGKKRKAWQNEIQYSVLEDMQNPLNSLDDIRGYYHLAKAICAAIRKALNFAPREATA